VQIQVAGITAYAYTGARTFDPALPVVVFMHGAACDHSVWALQSRYFAHHGWSVLAIDLPGHGRSLGKPLSSVKEIADWVVTMLDAAGVADAALVGHSLGSLAALDAAARHPERVSKLALLGTAVPMVVSDELLARARAGDHVAYELITGWSFSPDHLLGGNQQPGVWMAGNALRLMERSRPGALSADLLACHQYAAGLTSAAAVRCPTLVILGQRDLMVPPKTARELLAALADRRTLTIPDCGHSLMTEAPDAVLDALRAFL
jgi:pimeloyl-ACP methyl ester carboxylesterase